MNKAHELRQNSENCAELAKAAASEPAKKRFQRMADGWKTVAEDQEWLDGRRRDESSKNESQGGSHGNAWRASCHRH